MYRQLNSPREMMRRLAYLAYVGTILFFSIELVASCARPDLRNTSLAVMAFAAMVAVRHAGYRWLEFERLFQSFPTGCALDCIPEPVRAEVEGLVCEFHAPDTDWVRRLEIRRRLVELEERQPEILEAYAEDLHRVLAA